MIELTEQQEQRLTANGWQKLPWPAVPQWQRPGKFGSECLYTTWEAIRWLSVYDHPKEA